MLNNIHLCEWGNMACDSWPAQTTDIPVTDPSQYVCMLDDLSTGTFPVSFWLTYTHTYTYTVHSHTQHPLTTNQNCSNSKHFSLLPLHSVSSLLCVLIVQAFALKLNHLPSISVLFSSQCQKASLLTILWIVEPVVPQIKQCGTVICSVCVCVQRGKDRSLRTRVSFCRHLSFKAPFSNICWQVHIDFESNHPE